MAFQIHALPAERFQELFQLPDEELRRREARREIVRAKPGYPCRVSLEDADVGEIPESLRIRPISIRAFDACHEMIDAELAEGTELGPAIERLLANQAVAYLHLHNAKPGCYAARVTRA